MKLVILIFVFSLNLVAQSINSPNIDPTRLVVKIKINAQPPRSNNAYAIKKLFGRYVIYSTRNIDALKNELTKNPAVESVSYNMKWGAVSWPTRVNRSALLDNESSGEDTPFNDPKAKKLWGLAQTTQGINLYQHLAYVAEHNIAKTAVIVAVVDTGVDVKHDDLKGKIWVNTKEIPGNQIDDDKNGYVDDINGIDTLTRDSQGRATAHRNDGQGHGTHVSGTIAAVQNNNLGIAGVSSHAQILPIRTVPAEGDETDVDVAESFIYAAKMGARIINCSFGKDYETAQGILADAITEVEKINETLVVASSGNESKNIDTDLTYPASLSNNNLLVVDAIRNGGKLARFSNFGIKNTDVGAPGVNILSLFPGNNYATLEGTSMASPHVAGIAAEILSIFPKLTAQQLKEILIKSTNPQASLDKRSSSGGSVDVNKARDLAQRLINSGQIRNIRKINNGFQGHRI